jgi:formyl-CoA transferase
MHESLAGLRVLDLTSYLSGPFATLTLAGLGAEVIKIERRDGGDPARSFPPFCGAGGMALREMSQPDDESVAILKRNRGKKSMTLNLEAPEGRALFLQLAKSSDVVIENIAPGVMEKWGLGKEVLWESNPRLVICAISGYGRSGPKAHLPAFDPIVQASSLTMATNGRPEDAPMRTGISFGDTVPALYAVIGILAALRERDRTGKGKVIDIAMHDTLVAMLMVEPVEAQVEWGFPLRTASRIPRLAPCNVYSCRDGHVALNAAPPRLWQRLAAAIGKPDLRGEALVPLARRLECQEWIDSEVAAWVAPKTVDEVLALTAKAGVPCARVAEHLEELVDDPHTRFRGLLQPLEHTSRGVLPGLTAPAVPIGSEAGPYRPLARAPRLGEHTREILAAELALTDAAIRELESKNIV